jgi:type IV pilus assembly protein PilA
VNQTPKVCSGSSAAIAIPAFLNQKTKATDASAKELARTAQTTAETYATDHNGIFKGISKAEVKKTETSIVECTETAAKLGNACLKAAGAIESEKGFEVETESVSGATYKVRRDENGVVTRSCEAHASNGCPTGSW